MSKHILIETVEINISEPVLFQDKEAAQDEMAIRFASAFGLEIQPGRRPFEQVMDSGVSDPDNDVLFDEERAFCEDGGENHTWHIFELDL